MPFLDQDLVQWAAKLPPELKLRGREGKYVLKKALEPYVPEDILYRPKMGFSVPLGNWFRGPLKYRTREALLGPVLADTGIFDRKFLGHLIDHHQAGLKDYSAPIWSLLMFESFQRRLIAG